MSNRNALRLVSLLLKLCAVLSFIFLLASPLVSNFELIMRSRTDWTGAVRIVGGTVVSGLLTTLLAYGSAKAIDLLLSMARDIRVVGLMLKRQQPEPRENELPHAPNNQDQVWRGYAGSIKDGRNIVGYYYDENGQRQYTRTTKDPARLPRLGIDPPPKPPVQDWQRKAVPKPGKWDR